MTYPHIEAPTTTSLYKDKQTCKLEFSIYNWEGKTYILVAVYYKNSSLIYSYQNLHIFLVN